MDLVLIHQLKIAVVCSPEDWICYVPSGDFVYSLCNPLLESNGRKAEDVLTICFVLRVAICDDLRFDGAIINDGSFGCCY